MRTNTHAGLGRQPESRVLDIARKGRRFLGDNGGNMSMIFAMMLVPMTAFVGMAVDFGRGFRAHSDVQHSLDAAALAAGRQFDQTGNAQDAASRAREFFYKEVGKGYNAKLTNVTVDAQGNVKLTAKLATETTFLRLIGMKKIGMSAGAQSLVQDDGGIAVELAVVFDVTGSMDWNDKMEAAQAATTLLLNTLMPNGVPESDKVRVSLVPFSYKVKLPNALAAAAANMADRSTRSRACLEYYLWPSKKAGQCKTWGPYTYTASPTGGYYRRNCFYERMDALNGGTDDKAYGDAPPGPGTYFSPSITTNPDSVDCSPDFELVPLTSSKQTLLDKVATFYPTGSTAGHIGTAWGWYTISTRWSGFWPDGAKPAEKSEHLLKAIIIMTDGMYNTHYTSSGSTVSEDSEDPYQGNGPSADQALKICQKMKDDGVEVFAVGVELPEEMKPVLENCVSEPNYLFTMNHFMDVGLAALDSDHDGQNDLTEAFGTIGNAIASATNTGNQRLRLTQ